MTIRYIMGLLLLLGALGCLGMKQRESFRCFPGHYTHTEGWVSTGPPCDVPLSSFDHVMYQAVGILFSLGGIYCLILPWVQREPDSDTEQDQPGD